MKGVGKASDVSCMSEQPAQLLLQVPALLCQISNMLAWLRVLRIIVHKGM